MNLLSNNRFEITKVEKAILKAENNLESAKMNKKLGYLSASVSSSYFAYFWLVKALLFKKEIFDETYKGIRNKFRETYIKTDTIPYEYGLYWSELTNYREEADYDLNPEFTREDIEAFINWTQEFLDYIKQNIEKL